MLQFRVSDPFVFELVMSNVAFGEAPKGKLILFDPTLIVPKKEKEKLHKFIKS